MDSQAGPITKREIKSSVFSDLFNEPKYMRELYLSLHREDTAITDDQLQAITLEHIITDQRYNDLGFLARDKLMVLVEAQDTKNPNMPLRMLIYAAMELNKYINQNKLNIYGSKAVALPKPELYVVYSGTNKERPDTLTLSEVYFGGEKTDLDVTVHMLYGTPGGKDIVSQYLDFTRITREWLTREGRSAEVMRKIIKYCIAHGILSEYLIRKETEVIDMAIVLFDEDFIRDCQLRDAKAEGIAQGQIEAQAKADADKAEFIRNLKSMGYSTEDLAKAANMDVAEVAKI